MNDEKSAVCVSRGEIPPALGQWTATLLSRAAQQMREGFEERIAELGLKSKHYGTLILLKDGPLTQVEIGRSLWVDRTTMVGLVDDLMRLGLVDRAPHPEDRRAHAVTLTSQGQEVLEEATKAVDATEADCFAPLTSDEREQLRALLLKIL
ncbi:MarR family transcriptional regulator [bacterium]|nr:MAG: MarR family transcriptional regulator [bacterium]